MTADPREKSSRVRLLVDAVQSAAGSHYVLADRDLGNNDTALRLSTSAPCIVEVLPMPEPGTFGTVIRARIAPHLSDGVAPHVILSRADDTVTPWATESEGFWAWDDLTDVEVLFDPGAVSS